MVDVVSFEAPLGARIQGLERSSANDPDAARLLNRALAEHLSTEAIRSGKNLEAVVIDMLEAGAKR